MGNLIKNNKKIMVSITYIVYDISTSSSSSINKKDPSKIPLLGHKRLISKYYQNLLINV